MAIKVDVELKYFGLVHNLGILLIEILGTLCGSLCPGMMFFRGVRLAVEGIMSCKISTELPENAINSTLGHSLHDSSENEISHNHLFYSHKEKFARTYQQKYAVF